MNKKFVYLVLTVAITALLTATVALAAPTAPTVSPEVCVDVMGAARTAAHDESNLTWSLEEVSPGTSSFRSLPGGAGDVGAPNLDKACFDVTGISGDTYNLYVSSEDTLTSTVEITLPGSGDVGNVALELREGDISSVVASDNQIDLDDFAAFGTAFSSNGSLGDFDEDGDADLDDFALFGQTFGESGASARAARDFASTGGSRGASSITIREVAPGDGNAAAAFSTALFAVEITNPNAEEITLVSVDFSFDGSVFAAGANLFIGDECDTETDFGMACDSSLSIGDAITPDPSPNTGSFTIAVIEAFVTKTGGCGGAEPACADAIVINGGDAATETGTFYKVNSATPNENFSNCGGVGGTCDAEVLAVSMSNEGAAVVSTSAIVALMTVAAALGTTVIVSRRRSN